MREIRSELPRLKQVFFYTLVFSLAAHAYMYFTLAPSHDGLYSAIIGDWETTWQISLGRFLQPVYWLFRGRLPVPWLVGMLSVLFLSGSAFLMLRTLGIEGRVPTALLCGIFSTNITVTAGNAAYMPWADTYALALLLACGGAWLWEQCPRWGTAAAMVLFALSMGLYQAYIDVAIGLALMLLMKRALEGEPFSGLWRRAARYAVSLLGGAALYALLLKAALLLTGVALGGNESNSLSNLLDSGILSLLALIPRAYFDFAAALASPLRSQNTPFVCVCVGLLALTGLYLWVRELRRRHVKGLALAAVLVCAALLPLGLDFVYVLSGGERHDLMAYSFCLVYPLVLLPLPDGGDAGSGEKPRLLSGRTLALLLCGCMAVHNVMFANGAYYKKQLLFEAGEQYAFSIVEQMERDPDYEPGVTPVALVGDMTESYLARTTDDFPQYRNMTGMWDDTALTYPGAFAGYCANVLGHPINVIKDQSQLIEIAVRAATREMPVFPKEGYCRLIDGIMVVKLEDMF